MSVPLACLLLLLTPVAVLVARAGDSPADLLHLLHAVHAPSRSVNQSRAPAAGISLLSDRVEDVKEEEEDEEINLSSGHDCRTARAAAESSRRHNPAAKTYVPSCSSEGGYEEIQCYEGFCWCVDTSRGIPMKGSGSARNSSLPDCSRKKAVSRVRDCHLDQKLHFLKLLTALFRQQMLQARQQRQQSRQTARRSRSRTAILRWKFDRLDLDRDSRLDEREWRLFKQSLKGSKKRRNRHSAPYNNKSFKPVRHCFRLFFRGCDLNSDRTIIREEWLECTGSSSDSDSDSVQSVSSLAASHFRGRRQRARKGPHPFATILKPD